MHGICFIIACQKLGFCLKFQHIVFLLTSYSALSLLIFWFCSNECWNILVGNKCCKGEIFSHVYCFRCFKWSKHAFFQPWPPGSWVRSFGVCYSVILPSTIPSFELFVWLKKPWRSVVSTYWHLFSIYESVLLFLLTGSQC